jgi:hypothetical protein
MQRRVNHKSNLQEIPFRRPDSRQIRLPKRTPSRFQINDLGILHGRLTKAFCWRLGLGGAARLSLLIAAMITGRGGTATIHFEKYGSA